MIPQAVDTWLEQNHFGRVVAKSPVGGGCINQGMIIQTQTGQSFFLKVNSSAPADMFTREAEGLDALRVQDGPAVPQPLLHGPDFLLMEDLSPAPRARGYWESFGLKLAALHAHTAERFGFHSDNYIGSTPQPNPWTDDGFAFFSQHRLVYMARLAFDRGLLDISLVQQVERLAAQLAERVPVQPPSLIHGDLWSGNAITDARGGPAIIDPAAHYGWAEAELAMTTLFGSFPAVFYRAYESVRPLETGYRRRFPIYNLYHLLNHVYIFGRGYLGQVQTILRRFS